ncbi:DUF5035 domain-containing protein [Bacteroides congonensis]|uniref:DUF5035 domain-containing protein n=1 Tax=Bacteroides congonensis TaxID=1871006 RepID=UPI0023FA418D|nr:DUF5035 domain-containing protein [Bacteroides congonensis]
MKKRVLLLLPLFLGACSNSGESPVIKIEKLYVKAESDSDSAKEEDYANKMDELPALKVGDEVKALLLLDGNGAELKTFKLQKDNDEALDTKLNYEKNEVSTEGNLTDEENGQLRFKDGVTQTKVLVQATIKQVDKNGDVRLEFYLSSKAECEGAQEEIGLKTKVDDEKEE